MRDVLTVVACCMSDGTPQLVPIRVPNVFDRELAGNEHKTRAEKRARMLGFRGCGLLDTMIVYDATDLGDRWNAVYEALSDIGQGGYYGSFANIVRSEDR